MTHACAADNCDVIVPAKMLMCRKHWFALTPAMRSEIWRHYTPGQEDDTSLASRAYWRVVNDAKSYLCSKEVDSGL